MTAMTDKKRIRVAAGVTAMFLAAVSAAGIATHAASVRPSAPPPAAAAVAPTTAASAPSAADQPAVAWDRDDHDEDDDHDERGEHDDD